MHSLDDVFAVIEDPLHIFRVHRTHEVRVAEVSRGASLIITNWTNLLKHNPVNRGNVNQTLSETANQKLIADETFGFGEFRGFVCFVCWNEHASKLRGSISDYDKIICLFLWCLQVVCSRSTPWRTGLCPTSPARLSSLTNLVCWGTEWRILCAATCCSRCSWTGLRIQPVCSEWRLLSASS